MVYFLGNKIMDYSDIEALIEKCLDEVSKASEGFYDADVAERSSALILKTQMKLSYFIEEVEFKARMSKNDISRVEGEKYQELKAASITKITDAALTAAIATEKDVQEAKQNFARDESALKKWNYLSNTLTNAHVFFRGFNKKSM